MQVKRWAVRESSPCDIDNRKNIKAVKCKQNTT